MIKYKICLMCALVMSTMTNAEFNIENNSNQSAYIKLGYRNILNSYFIYVNNDKNVNLKKNTVYIPYEDVSILLQPVRSNNNKIKGNDYYFFNYEALIKIENTTYKLPFIISDVSAIGASVLFNDNNISIFSIESYVNPVSNNNSKKFKSDIYILNKKNLGLYNPIFLSLNKKLENLNEVSMEFSKLVSVKYNKNEKSYQIVYQLQNALEDFSSTGKVVYEKSPIEYSFVLISDQKKPFLIKNFFGKRKGSKKNITNNDSDGMYFYYLNENKI